MIVLPFTSKTCASSGMVTSGPTAAMRSPSMRTVASSTTVSPSIVITVEWVRAMVVLGTWRGLA